MVKGGPAALLRGAAVAESYSLTNKGKGRANSSATVREEVAVTRANLFRITCRVRAALISPLLGSPQVAGADPEVPLPKDPLVCAKPGANSKRVVVATSAAHGAATRARQVRICAIPSLPALKLTSVFPPQVALNSSAVPPAKDVPPVDNTKRKAVNVNVAAAQPLPQVSASGKPPAKKVRTPVARGCWH